jgi:uncharacterized protein (TIGR02271 family)
MSLIRLSEDRTLHVAEDEPQVQHFGFYNDKGDKLGSIKDLIADTETMKVRFLIVSWHEGILERKDLIIPVRDVMIDTAAKRVICGDCTPERLQGYPEYKGGILPDLTKRFTATFLPHKEATGESETPTSRMETMADQTIMDRDVGLRSGRDLGDEARMDVIEEELQVGKRDVPIGEAVIRKTVSEHEVCEPVELRQEHVEIERHAVNRPANVAPGTGEMEVHVPLMGQEVVKNKTAFVREEIILRKVADVDKQTVCDTVRSETVDTSDLDRMTKTDVGAEPVSKTDLAGDKVDLQPDLGMNEALGRPDHLYDEPLDRPLL